MSDVTININGGNNQVLPNATQAVQSFYGNQPAESESPAELPDDYLSPEAVRLLPYINKEEDLSRYLALIIKCRTVTELARVILSMQEREPKITSDEMVKERFISLFLPITPNITKGKTVTTSAHASTTHGATGRRIALDIPLVKTLRNGMSSKS